MTHARHRSSSISSALLVGVLAGSVFFSNAARAQPVDNSKALAEALFEKGRELLEAKNYDEACPKLEESQRLEPKLGTLLNVALCHEGQNRTATAWAEFKEAANLAELRKEQNRVDFAREHATALKARLSFLTLQKTGDTPGLVIKLDNKVIESVLLGVGLPLDPGDHTVVVSATGYAEFNRRITIQPGPIQQQLEIPALVKLPDKVPDETPPPKKEDPPPKKVEPVEPDEGPGKAIAITGFTIGGASLIVAIVTGAVTIAQVPTLREKCTNDVCTGQDAEDLDTANAIANASNATFAIAGVGAVVGVIGLLIAPPKPTPPKAASARFFSVGDVGAGLSIALD
ncbi:MAG: hypothetical protein U0271_29705 [Polyangiaceae bacterium]